MKIATVALALMLLGLIWGFTPISRFANPEAAAAAMAIVSASPWQFAIVLGCFLGAGLVVFPMLLLIIACAAVFGPVRSCGGAWSQQLSCALSRATAN